MSNILVVMYSHRDHCRQLAKLLCEEQDWPVAEITEVRPRKGLSGIWHCLLDSLWHRRPAIRYDGPPLCGFDAVVLISPTWFHRLAAPMRSFVSLQREHLPDISVVSVTSGRRAPSVSPEISRLSGRTPVLNTTFTAREIADGSCAGRAQMISIAIQASADTGFMIWPVVSSPQLAAA